MSLVHNTGAISLVAREKYPAHARHGFVSHEAVLTSYEIDVRCECGEVLRIAAEDVQDRKTVEPAPAVDRDEAIVLRARWGLWDA